MITTKNEFIKTFLPEKVSEITYAQIDLDISDLSIADILRNVNRTYPNNSRNRNAIKSGVLAVGVLCKSETLQPLAGLLMIITDEDTTIDVVSKNFIIISIPESKIIDDDSIKLVIDGITTGLLKGFRDTLADFNSFYAKYVYDRYELEAEEDD